MEILFNINICWFRRLDEIGKCLVNKKDNRVKQLENSDQGDNLN